MKPMKATPNRKVDLMDTCKVCGGTLTDGFCPECGYASDGTEPIFCAPDGTANGTVDVEQLDVKWTSVSHGTQDVALAYVNGDPCIVDKDGTVLAVLDKGIARKVLGEYVRSLNYIVNWRKLSNSSVAIDVVGLGDDIDSDFGGGDMGLDFFM